MDGIYTPEGIVDKSALWLKYRFWVRKEALNLQVKLPASVELDDLIQAGALGLLNAIDNFDPKKGIALSTYLTQRVRWALIDELRERDWVPRRVRNNSRQLSAAIRRIEQEAGKAASEAEIAEEMGVSLAEYHAMLAESNNSIIFSLDELQEEYGDSFEQPDSSHEALDPLNETFFSRLVSQTSSEIKKLPEREQLLLSLYYQQELNMKEIGYILDITETRVSQLHSQAIKRLRARMDASK
ncbi:RNA polymerase, sigma 28 subunit, SigD/FliA/WhiG [Kosakonia arachidis]|uniref:RNA polymerase sigma factor n=1 Tax=Kosakonia arachidis TaxID=551989 RepID=A0A1I7E8E4_9ENTR|nr:RNA polymerase sigma factor FliA [Kosakonia arachidis]SFU20207.1 RNA polymerase, sigma 28 subunit, SigD/FliA/WhiG [Kosakonia arachidis]